MLKQKRDVGDKAMLIIYIGVGAIAGFLTCFFGRGIVWGTIGGIAGAIVGLILGFEHLFTRDTLHRFHIICIVEFVQIAGTYTLMCALSYMAAGKNAADGSSFGLMLGFMHGSVFALARTEYNKQIEESLAYLFQKMAILAGATGTGVAIGAIAGAFNGNPLLGMAIGGILATFVACYVVVYIYFISWVEFAEVFFNQIYSNHSSTTSYPLLVFLMLLPASFIVITIVSGCYGYLMDGSFAVLAIYLAIHGLYFMGVVVEARLAKMKDRARVGASTESSGEPPVKHQWLVGHDKLVYSVAFSPGGDVLVTGSEDKTARLWNVASGEQFQVLKHKESVSSVAVSPGGDLIATGSSDGRARLWSMKTFELFRAMGDSKGMVCMVNVAFSPDGKVLATGSPEGVRLWDVATGVESVVFSGYHDAAYSVAFSPAGGMLATGSDDGIIHLLDVTTGKELHTLHGPRGYRVYAFAFSPDGHLLATGFRNKHTWLWDVKTGKKIRVLKGDKDGEFGGVSSVSFAPGGGVLAVGVEYGTITLWDMVTNKKLRVFEEGRHNSMNSIKHSPDGRLLAVGSFNKTIGHAWLLSLT